MQQPLSDRPADGPSGPRAGFWRRAGAALIDGVILFLFNLLVRYSFGLAAATALSLIVGIGYYTLQEGGPRGQTPGKMVMGIRVIGFQDGRAIGYGRAFIRYLGRILSTIALLIGYLWMLWDRERQTWHDKLSDAVVVPLAAYPIPA